MAGFAGVCGNFLAMSSVENNYLDTIASEVEIKLRKVIDTL